MPAAEMTRTVLAVIPDAEDRELRVCLVRYPGNPEFGEYVEIAEYIPSRDLYGRGYAFPQKYAAKVQTGIRAAKAAAS